jgi:hypothetical protein
MRVLNAAINRYSRMEINKDTINVFKNDLAISTLFEYLKKSNKNFLITFKNNNKNGVK